MSWWPGKGIIPGDPSTVRRLALALLMGLFMSPASSVITADDYGALERFQGVWIGEGVVVAKQTHRDVPPARDIDLAIWRFENGFVMTWRNLTRNGDARTTIRFVAVRDLDTLEVIWTNLPQDAIAKLKLEDNRLTALVSRVDDDFERVDRYDFSVSNDGRMTLDYTLSHSDELIETVTGSLHRAKVLM